MTKMRFYNIKLYVNLLWELLNYGNILCIKTGEVSAREKNIPRWLRGQALGSECMTLLLKTDGTLPLASAGRESQVMVTATATTVKGVRFRRR